MLHAQITLLFVHPSFHCHGIGAMLLDHAKQHVAVGLNINGLSGISAGEVLLEVRCFEKNPRALKFYERGGFVRRVGAEEWREQVQEYLALLVWLKL
ncbi:hypothetical protein DFH07DRAFT_807080 [Mycena maculata]|uniref:N-acetyltransferase domain-containing protein n=1 Tax=Mycena maculata TaxID=230809 RepID=A0AAD7NNK8_9AGAR|nr:hypothetical protein DFH07DRAFT_807080 [Mycena maculata]